MNKLTTLLLLQLLAVHLYGLELQSPQDETLLENTILKIGLHRSVETLLLFPHQIQHLSGSGLVNEGKGHVQYQVGVEGKTLVLRPLGGSFSVLMQVMVDGKVYAMQLEASETPASIIRFQDPDVIGLKIRSEIDLKEVEDLVRLPSKPRLGELIRLAKEEAFLKPQLPELYEGSESRPLSVKVDHASYRYQITQVTKFRKEDTIVIAGDLLYQAEPGARSSERPLNIQLTINANAFYAFTHFEIFRDDKDPKKPLRFVGALVGDGEGKPGHIDLSNTFGLSVTEAETFQESKPQRLDQKVIKWSCTGLKVVAAGALIVLALGS